MHLETSGNSDTMIVLVHEIYGVNRHMEYVQTRLSAHHFVVACPNLLDQSGTFDYAEESIAYRNFMQLGFVSAANRLKSVLRELRPLYRNVYVVGYSVGATTGWLCSGEEGLMDGFVGFYGSRIRDYLSVTPQCPALLFFPTEEIAFDVDDLVNQLRQQKYAVSQFDGKHGFADPDNANYSPEADRQSFNELLRFIS